MKKKDIFGAKCTGEFINQDGERVTLADVVKNMNDLCDGENNPQVTLWQDNTEFELVLKSIELNNGWITVVFQESDYEDFDLESLSFEASEVFDMGECQINFYSEEEGIEGVIESL